MSLSDDDLERIEAQYRRSRFVKEICVAPAASQIVGRPGGLDAVVIPDMHAMRRGRIVNVGDLLRFELEGQSIHLSVHERIAHYEIWFEPLPRTPSGHVDRSRVREQSSRRRDRAEGRRPEDPRTGVAADDACAAAVVESLARRAGLRGFGPDANLEIDLGFDSMKRVELLAELEQRFGKRLAEESALNVLTVAQLIEAFRGSHVLTSAAPPADAWALVLRDLPAPSDPALGWLLNRRPVSTVSVYVLMRLLRLLLPRVIVSGREHLPARGPYIISPNHQSYLDPFVVCSTLPYAMVRQLFAVGAAEYFATPLTAWVARRCSLLPVDPDANLLSAMRGAAFGLKHGRILVLFPEGERSIDGGVKHFKKGVAILARHMNVPIIPAAIRGMYEIWPRNRPFNRRALLPGAPHRIHVAFGPAVRIDEGVEYDAAAAALQRRVSEMWSNLPSSAEHRRDGQRNGAFS